MLPSATPTARLRPGFEPMSAREQAHYAAHQRAHQPLSAPTRGTAIVADLQQNTLLTTTFFLEENVRRLHLDILEYVRRALGRPIERQSLFGIRLGMRQIFERHLFGQGDPDDPENVRALVARMNPEVVVLVGDHLLKNARQHLAWLRSCGNTPCWQGAAPVFDRPETTLPAYRAL